MDFLKHIIEWLLELPPNQLAVVNLYFSIFGMLLTVVIGLCGVFYAATQFQLKSSTKISATCGSGGSAYYRDEYVTSVVLENHRDKAEAIFGIYLRLGRNLYITLEDFQETPLILPPFEIVQRNYLPISGYGCNGYSVDLNKVLGNSKKWPKRIVLATSRGKYITKKWKKGWNPIFDSLLNNNIVTLETYSAEYQTLNGEMRTVPSNAIYIVDYKNDEGERLQSIVFSGKSAWLNDKRFAITPSCLKDKDSLLFHLQTTISLDEKGVDRSSFEIIMVSEIPEVKRYKEHYTERASFLPSNSRFMNIVGKAFAFIDQLRLDRNNHDRNAKGMTYLEKRVVVVYAVFATLIVVLTVGYYFWWF
jgi:hypothetical protein